MKRILIIATILLISYVATAKQVNDSIAQKAAVSFINHHAIKPFDKVDSRNVQLVYISKGNVLLNNELVSQNLFYVFNIDTIGFVMVAADDNALPILGYSFNNVFDANKLHISIKEYLDVYKKQLVYIIEHQLHATEDIINQWNVLLIENNNTAHKPTIKGNQPQNGTAVVGPLVQTTWNQSPYYNAACPYDYNNGGRTVTGCVATALAQVLKYWNSPTQGSGFHSYTPSSNSGLGVQSVDFSNTTYQWSSMPNALYSSTSSTQVNAVATLIYHCGVSVNMDYGVNESSAYVVATNGGPTGDCAEHALKTYFGFNAINGVSRVNYSDAQWISILEAEFNAGRPVIHDGWGTGGGHCFVADGYDNNNLIHYNWGWGGYCDGYFQISALNPLGVGTGGGTGGFNNTQEAIINIQPSAVTTSDMRLYNYVSTSSSTINYGDGFTITTNIANYGTTTYNGDYCAAVFDNSGNFIDYIGAIQTSQSLPANSHYTNDRTFTTTGIYAMVPGTYSVYVYHRPTGGSWQIIANNGSYTNYVQIIVANNDAIALWAAINITTGNLVQGQNTSLNLNIVNNGSTTFTGQYKVALYDLSGNFIQYIGSGYTESNGLQASYRYNNPMTFSSTITASPGTYILAMIYQPTGDNNWYWGGAGSYQNPIVVNVLSAPVYADAYETNNAINQSYLLPYSFSGNSAYVNTNGSTIHITSDQDFYKIKLPKGYNYTIKARLNDSYYSGNGITYTVDGLFSYSTDSSTWSSTYDDSMPKSIVVGGGKTMFLHVAPYFAGKVGTYLLEIWLTRTIAIPLTFIDVNAEYAENNIKVGWKVAYELNTSYFNIQRSEDGNEFTTIGKAAAIGMGDNQYAFTDPLNSTNVLPKTLYYRIQEIDKDGSYNYSKTVAVDIKNNQDIVVYPNPIVGNQLHLAFQQLPIKGNYEVGLYNLSGKLVQKQSITYSGGTESFVLTLSNTVIKGIYQLIITDSKGVRYHKQVAVQ